MNKNEQDMIRKIKEKSEQVPVPKAGSSMPGANRGSDGMPELF